MNPNGDIAKSDQEPVRPIPLDHLDYEFHWQQARVQFGLDQPAHEETRRYAECDAQYGHALWVFDPLRDLMLNAIGTAQKLINPNARIYMQYGAGRRLGMMFHAYRHILFNALPNRDKPLTYDEEQTISRDINVLYMHTRGVLDNYAWSLLYETNTQEAERIVAEDKGRTWVDMFHPKFKTLCPAFATIEPDMKAHAAWSADLKQRRDPVAHRIPLYIPPSAITQGEAERYASLAQQHIDLAAAHDFEGSQAAFDSLHALGTFTPVFMHDPNDGPIPIYPTMPTDMAHVIRISTIIERALLNPVGPTG